MGKPIAVRTLKVMDYLRKNPDVAAAEVAGKFGMSLSQVYGIRKRVRAEDLTAEINEELKKMEWTVSTTDDSNLVATLAQPEGEPIKEVLQERGNRYGTFESNAKTCQLLKNVLHSQDGWYRLSYVQREAVEMIMHKVSRLVNGDATYLDTVVDISGYNQLMLDHMRETGNGQKMEE